MVGLQRRPEVARGLSAHEGLGIGQSERSFKDSVFQRGGDSDGRSDPSTADRTPTGLSKALGEAKCQFEKTGKTGPSRREWHGQARNWRHGGRRSGGLDLTATSVIRNDVSKLFGAIEEQTTPPPTKCYGIARLRSATDPFDGHGQLIERSLRSAADGPWKGKDVESVSELIEEGLPLQVRVLNETRSSILI